MSKTLNWGIIGPGKIARKFADDLKRVPAARLHAVASTSPERARDFAHTHHVPHVFDRYEDMVHCPDLHIVYVATPHTLHCANTLLCLDHGLSVLCEKPFAMNSVEARSMVALARQKGVFLMDALWTRFIPATCKALEIIQAGTIGEVHTVKSDFGFFAPFDPHSRLFNKSIGGGSLLDIGIYPVLFSLFVLGVPQPEHIDALATFASTDVDDTCHFTFRYADKKLAIGHSTVRANTPIEAFIYGTKGHIQLHTRWHHAHQLTVVRYEGREAHSETIDLSYEGWGYQFEAAHVTERVLQGHLESDLVPLDFSLALMETLDTIREKIGLQY
jgi:predicted dehydrogenase